MRLTLTLYINNNNMFNLIDKQNNIWYITLIY